MRRVFLCTHHMFAISFSSTYGLAFLPGTGVVCSKAKGTVGGGGEEGACVVRGPGSHCFVEWVAEVK